MGYPNIATCANMQCARPGGREREAVANLMVCGTCRAVRYCGQECQKVHWQQGHRKECRVLSQQQQQQQ